MVLNRKELENIVGGGRGFAVSVIIGGILTILTGFLDGQIKLKWQKLKNTVFKGNFVEKPSIQIHQEDAIMYIKL